ncbi:MAG: Toxin [Chlamydiae bacterium]|nr:Toxin [Chlamydiota bacterium]
MKKYILLLLFLKLSLGFAQDGEDFDLLMGRETPAWQYVKTSEDMRRLKFFRTLFQKQISHIAKNSPSKNKIPKTFHVIWLGPENFPEQSIDRLKQWVQLHPDWTFKFWTDVDRMVPHPEMKKYFVSDFSFQKLGNEYYHSVNFGEKANILAYEILIAEGGVYVDHDTLPYKSFNSLHQQFDFYCGLEELAPTILSSSVIPSTHLIGVKPDHPILKETVSWLENHWDQLEQCYPGESMHEATLRVKHRSFWAFSEGIDRGINQKGNNDVVFPVAYFNGKRQKASSYALHFREEKWCNPRTNFERKVNEKFQEMIHKDDEAVVLTLVLAFVSFLACIFLLFYVRSVKRRTS